jgi:hypothetical protein
MVRSPVEAKSGGEAADAAADDDDAVRLRLRHHVDPFSRFALLMWPSACTYRRTRPLQPTQPTCVVVVKRSWPGWHTCHQLPPCWLIFAFSRVPGEQ